MSLANICLFVTRFLLLWAVKKLNDDVKTYMSAVLVVYDILS
jgi:hypothetical protein